MGCEEGLIGAASMRRHLGVYLPDYACRDGTFGASLASLLRLCVSKIESRTPLSRVDFRRLDLCFHSLYTSSALVVPVEERPKQLTL